MCDAWLCDHTPHSDGTVEAPGGDDDIFQCCVQSHYRNNRHQDCEQPEMHHPIGDDLHGASVSLSMVAGLDLIS